MGYLFQGKVPQGDWAKERVIAAARFFNVLGDKLYISGKLGRWREVPPIAERWDVMNSLHELSHCGARAMYATLRKEFFWSGMREDCVQFVN